MSNTCPIKPATAPGPLPVHWPMYASIIAIESNIRAVARTGEPWPGYVAEAEERVAMMRAVVARMEEAT